MTEDKMVGWHHQFNGHEFEQALRDGEGQRRLACCSPGGHKELDTTERPNNNSNTCVLVFRMFIGCLPPNVKVLGSRYFISALYCGSPT